MRGLGRGIGLVVNGVGCAAASVLLLAALAGCGDGKPAGTALAPAPKTQITWREGAEHAERAPISLTSADGNGLALVSLSARTVIEDPLAFTELHLVFHNPEARRREGRFEITLPAQAAISRFAMRVGDALQEGEVVERRRAQQVYEDALHRKQDPALLENQAGNEFSARVFPIEANADKEIILSYSEELPQRGDAYRMLLQGLPALQKLDVEIQVGSSSSTGLESSERARGQSAKLSLHEENYAPGGDLEVQLPAQKAVALRSGEWVVARVVPKLANEPVRFDGLTVLLDTSASRALGFGAQLERLGALLAALHQRMGSDFDLSVLAFDQGVHESYHGPASGFGLREQSALLARDALGASNLSQALAAVARASDKHPRVLVIGDGVITAGADDATALRETVAKLAAHGVTRLDALAEGGIQDQQTLSLITNAGLPNAGVVLDAHAAVATLADKLLSATHDHVAVQVTGASWVYPTTLQGVQAGDAALVFAQLPADAPLQIELVGAGAEAFETMEAPKPLIERAVARAKIEASSAELRALPLAAAEQRATLEQSIIELSLRERVVSDYTALLVLETPADYARFGIAQDALTSILQVGSEGLELFDRKQLVLQPDDQPTLHIAREPEEEARERAVDKAPTDDGPRKGSGQGEVAQAEAAPQPSAAAAPADPMAAAQPASAAAPMPAAVRRDRDAIGASTGRLGDLGSLDVGNEGGGAAKKESASRGLAAAADRAELARPAPKAAGAGLEDGALLGAGRSGSGLAIGNHTGTAEAQVAIAEPQLVPHAEVTVHGGQGLSSSDILSAVRGALRARAQQCYAHSGADPAATERLGIELSITDKGTVSDAFVSSGALPDRATQACILAATRALRFPKPESGNASAQLAITLSVVAQTQPDTSKLPGAYATRPKPRPHAVAVKIPTPALDDAYSGALAGVLAALQHGDSSEALTLATAAHAHDPGDVLGLVALGEALEASQNVEQAARAYGSIIDLFPSRADLRRMASERLERLGTSSDALELAVDSYQHAAEQRPDQPSGPRSLAYALVKQGQYQRALDVLAQAAERSYPEDRFAGVSRVLREDLGLVGAAFVRAQPAMEPQVQQQLAAHGATLDHKPSLRFILSWETDANDVDFHIYDGRGGHAFYQKPKLASGGQLYADITTGYGPECFAIEGRTRAYPYVLQAHYFARGPMGYGMGKLQVIDHDGNGMLSITEHPFVIMKDKAFIELARLNAAKR